MEYATSMYILKIMDVESLEFFLNTSQFILILSQEEKTSTFDVYLKLKHT